MTADTMTRPVTPGAPTTERVVIVKPTFWGFLKAGVKKTGRGIARGLRFIGRVAKRTGRRAVRDTVGFARATKPVAKSTGRVAVRTTAVALLVPVALGRFVAAVVYNIAPIVGTAFLLTWMARFLLAYTSVNVPMWGAILIVAAAMIGATWLYAPLAAYAGFVFDRVRGSFRTMTGAVVAEAAKVTDEVVAEAVANDDVEVKNIIVDGEPDSMGNYPSNDALEDIQHEHLTRHFNWDGKHQAKSTSVAGVPVVTAEQAAWTDKGRLGPVNRKLTDREESVLREGRFEMLREMIGDIESHGMQIQWDADAEGVATFYSADVSDGIFNLVMTDKLDSDWKIETLARAFEHLTSGRDAGPAQRGYAMGRSQALDAYLRERSELFVDPGKVFNQIWMTYRKNSGMYPHNTFLKGFMDEVEELKDVYAPELKRAERDAADAVETERLRNAPA